MLLGLFFFLRNGEEVIKKLRVGSRRAFGAAGEDIGRRIIKSVPGTVNGLVEPQRRDRRGARVGRETGRVYRRKCSPKVGDRGATIWLLMSGDFLASSMNARSVSSR